MLNRLISTFFMVCWLFSKGGMAQATTAAAGGATKATPLIYLYTNDIPVWLQVMLGITACVAALLLFTCLTLCCMRLCGCWTGNILGFGALRRSVDDTDHIGCWCCRPPVLTSRRVEDDNGSYVIHYKNGNRR